MKHLTAVLLLALVACGGGGGAHAAAESVVPPLSTTPAPTATMLPAACVQVGTAVFVNEITGQSTYPTVVNQTPSLISTQSYDEGPGAVDTEVTGLAVGNATIYYTFNGQVFAVQPVTVQASTCPK